MYISPVEMAVKLITGSSGNGHNSRVQNLSQGLYRREFTGNTKNTPLMFASSQSDLNFEQDEIDETRDTYNSEDSNFSATRYKYDRRAHAHGNVPGRNCVGLNWKST